MGELEREIVCRVCGEAIADYEWEDDYICEKCLEAETDLKSIRPVKTFRILKPRKIK